MPAPTDWEIVERIPRYQGFFTIAVLRLRHALFRGGWSEVMTRELFERGDSVAVVPYDPVQDRIVLIQQFRVGALRAGESPWLWEIIAGVAEEDEPPDQVARREALEEAGCTVRHLLRIGEFYTSPGGSSEKLTLYCGIVDSTGIGGIHGLAEEHEDIRVQVVEYAELLDMMERGDISSAVPYMGLQWLTLNRERLRREYAEGR
ncbi:NUDIX domain-containing protein [Methylogaea oryzae]|uniref:ADP-ribose pyrophosphatase n=1 Tax=Methylogaea oryzae TaxID=1295382 RepID=A0A8D4VNJ5_9GAMM|nr:NUDIX domain-containing protein [Methylogaea oryzae]BBL70494.1 ADP-ribose pyrophosphatase [Methylogaea oryzae]